MTSLNSAIPAKRDLHVGGVGTEPAAALSTIAAVDPLADASEALLRKAGELARGAAGYVRENPLAAIGLVGVLGLAAGYLISSGRRRDAKR